MSVGHGLTFMRLSPVSDVEKLANGPEVDFDCLDWISADIGFLLDQNIEETTKMSDSTPTNGQSPSCPRQACSSQASSICFCASAVCKRKYKRILSHSRVLEQSSKLIRMIGGVKVKSCQITIPVKLQKFVACGSCGHIFDALKLFMKYIQLELGWYPKEGGYRFKLPSATDYKRARRIMLGIGLPVKFYVHEWVPTFHERFIAACGGLDLVQAVAERFFTEDDLHLMY